jgi:hypothetical protein
MVLGFKQFYDTQKKQPTHFREKILLGVKREPTEFYIGVGAGPVTKAYYGGDTGPITYHVYDGSKRLADRTIYPKITTIREDLSDRWKDGMKIDMVYRGAGYKIIDHFNKDYPELQRCVSTQKIEIKWLSIHTKLLPPFTNSITDSSGFSTTQQVSITIDGKNINAERLTDLARNDGFDSPEDFLMWFSEDFTGKVLHFTDLKY